MSQFFHNFSSFFSHFFVVRSLLVGCSAAATDDENEGKKAKKVASPKKTKLSKSEVSSRNANAIHNSSNNNTPSSPIQIKNAKNNDEVSEFAVVSCCCLFLQFVVAVVVDLPFVHETSS